MKPHTVPLWAIVIHHTEEVPCSFREVEQFHMKERGWEAIGYHWFIDHAGVITKGRDENLIGSHALGRNDGTVGVCLEGNYLPSYSPPKASKPSDGQMSALLALLHQIRARHGDLVILGHKEVMCLQVGSFRPRPTHTNCPGLLMDFVREANEAEMRAGVGVQ